MIIVVSLMLFTLIYLNSLVGSWAPLMLAQPWRAFLTWQSERVKRGNLRASADTIDGTDTKYY